MKIHNSQSGRSYYQKKRSRFDVAGDPHELTFSCFQQFAFLNQDRTRQWLIDALNSARQKSSIDLWAYVIMPDHVHLLVYPRIPGTKLGPIAGTIKESVARRAIKYLETNSPNWLSKITVREGNRVRRRFWQPGGGFDRNVLEISTLQRMINYIHDNPVRRGLVKKPENWEWSSARWYAGIRPVAIEIDRTIPMYHDAGK